mmetsp:Transcript_34122/g.71873  ORF Transcript_34122/g.71873 Transcript_34122/m.71873 type:complete len:410 (-) Transcript_34122:2319-3548(-)
MVAEGRGRERLAQRRVFTQRLQAAQQGQVAVEEGRRRRWRPLALSPAERVANLQLHGRDVELVVGARVHRVVTVAVAAVVIVRRLLLENVGGHVADGLDAPQVEGGERALEVGRQRVAPAQLRLSAPLVARRQKLLKRHKDGGERVEPLGRLGLRHGAHAVGRQPLLEDAVVVDERDAACALDHRRRQPLRALARLGRHEPLHARERRELGLALGRRLRLWLGVDAHHHRRLQPRHQRLRLVLRLPPRHSRGAAVAQLLAQRALKLGATALPPAVAPAVVLVHATRHGRAAWLRLPQRATNLRQDIFEEKVDGETLWAENGHGMYACVGISDVGGGGLLAVGTNRLGGYASDDAVLARGDEHLAQAAVALVAQRVDRESQRRRVSQRHHRRTPPLGLLGRGAAARARAV